MRFRKLIFLALAFFPGLDAQIGPPKPAAPTTASAKDPLNRDSPQSTVIAFLEACHARDYARARKYLDLRDLRQDERLTEGTTVAQQLEQILDRDAKFDVANLTRMPEGSQTTGLGQDRERVDSFRSNGKTLDIELQRVHLQSGLWVWLFSGDTVERIPQIAVLTSSSPIEKHLPAPLVNWKLIDTSLWRWIALVVLALVLAAFSKLLARAALVIADLALKRIAPRVDRSALLPFQGPLGLLLATTLFRGGAEVAGPSALLRLYLDRAVALMLFVALFWLASVIVDLVIGRVRIRLGVRHRVFSHSVLPLVTRVTKLVILVFIIITVLSNWGFNTSTILAGLGVGGLAIALAAQKTIENLFGGVAVISDHPVSVGDFCKSGNLGGTVEDIGLRSTRLRTPDRTLVTVPNGQFSSMTIENISQRDKMMFHFTLNLRRDTTPDQVRALLGSITKTLAAHPKLEAGKLPVRFVGVGAYSLDLEVFVYVLTTHDEEFLKIQQDLLLWILDAVESAGTALALPTQASIDYAVAGAQQNGHNI